ncbi:MAG: ATP-binding protein [Synergistaceae bacterium]|nr:ATP-binding protein [Synergistaceae bacterium]
MGEYIFGSHILESLTTGMYQDSRMIFREYIQNACDSIDNAVKTGLLSDKSEGVIDVNINRRKRTVTIKDNGTGIKSSEFARVLSSIADSDKKAGVDKGFRGIGRLCGLAYCEKLIFTAKFAGEKVISKLICDAELMRELTIGKAESEHEIEKRYTASEVLNFINEFIFTECRDSSSIDDHYFIVELVNINKENTDLLDYDGVSDYLSFTVPLPYSITFSPYRSMIHEYAEKLGFVIDEYNIFLNDEQLFKPYTVNFITGRGKGKAGDEIIDLWFEKFKDVNNNLIAWLWLGVSHFRGVISEECLMRGIRIRKENIQIGDADTLQRFFSESRGQRYFIGELFCVAKDLIPNSQRDYFNENKLRVEFEYQISHYCAALSRVYHGGSKLNKLLATPDDAAENELEIEKLRHSHGIIRRIIQDYEEKIERKTEPAERIIRIHSVPVRKYSKRESRLLEKVFGVIKSSLDSDAAYELINTIKDELDNESRSTSY